MLSAEPTAIAAIASPNHPLAPMAVHGRSKRLGSGAQVQTSPEVRHARDMRQRCPSRIADLSGTGPNWHLAKAWAGMAGQT